MFSTNSKKIATPQNTLVYIISNIVVFNSILLVCILNIQTFISRIDSDIHKIKFLICILAMTIAIIASSSLTPTKSSRLTKQITNNEYNYDYNDIHIEEIENAV